MNTKTTLLLTALFSGIVLLTSCSDSEKNDPVDVDKQETESEFSSLEDSIMEVVSKFPEVLKEIHLVDSLSGGKRGITILVTQSTEDLTVYDIRVAEDNGDALATYFLYTYSTVSKTFNTVMSIHEMDPIPDIDPVLVETSKKIVEALAKGNYKLAISAMHPKYKLRFSPYAYIDTVEQKPLSMAGFLDNLDKKRTWGSYDGSGDPIVLTGREYMKRFVYNVDFLKIGEVYINETKGTSNSMNNLKEIYTGCDFVEYYYPGNDESGTTWASLRLVFKKQEGTYYLIAIVHDEWTV